MGLLYVFPVSHEEKDFVVKNNDELTLKTYGLPYIFWFYALCCIAVVFFMFIAIKEPVLKLASLGDDTDKTLAYSLLSFVGLSPIAILAFFFYEKRIVRNKNIITISHRVFALTVMSEKILLDDSDTLEVKPFISSPNMARLNSNEENLGFQNKGYFVLSLVNKDGKKIQIDRHSRKADLDKLKELILSV